MNKPRCLRLKTNKGAHEGWLIMCPACGYSHLADSRWTFNGNEALPTFRPSLLVPASASCHRCHSFVTDGKIQYLGDCTHALAGQTVDLPEFD